MVALATAANGLVASSALDALIRVWDCNTHETTCVMECPPAENWELVFQPGETPQHIAVAGGAAGSVKLYAIAEGEGALLSELSLPSVGTTNHAARVARPSRGSPGALEPAERKTLEGTHSKRRRRETTVTHASTSLVGTPPGRDASSSTRVFSLITHQSS